MGILIGQELAKVKIIVCASVWGMEKAERLSHTHTPTSKPPTHQQTLKHPPPPPQTQQIKHMVAGRGMVLLYAEVDTFPTEKGPPGGPRGSAATAASSIGVNDTAAARARARGQTLAPDPTKWQVRVGTYARVYVCVYLPACVPIHGCGCGWICVLD